MIYIGLVGGNPELEAEQSSSVEIGHQHRIKINERLTLDVKNTLYYSLIDDYIQWVPTTMGFWRAENLKEVQSSGIETSLGLNYRKKQFNQRLAFNYNFNRAINLRKNHPEDASVGQQLIYQPRHQYNLNSRSAYQKYFFDANLQFVGRRYLQSDNLDYLPYFSLIDLSIGRSIAFGNDKLMLSVSVRNLLDEEYQAIQWRPMPGRNYMLSLNYVLRVMRSYIYFISMLALLLSCKDDPPEKFQTQDMNIEGRGVWVLNEGNFRSANSSITLHFPDMNEEFHDYYKNANQGLPLGDVAQSMSKINGEYWVVVNNSEKIEVVGEEWTINRKYKRIQFTQILSFRPRR